MSIVGNDDRRLLGWSFGCLIGGIGQRRSLYHVLAFSPGFMEPPTIVGRPRIFVSHGTMDEVLGIDASSRVFVPSLKGTGYQVRYHEFDGPHTVPPYIAREALKWFTS